LGRPWPAPLNDGEALTSPIVSAGGRGS
jgi:hypothetical protein